MPTQVSYPGVYIEEVPSGVRTITGVATSITAFLGRAPRGPVDDPIPVNSFADFERVFGGVSAEFMMTYAVRDFFLNGGSRALIVRLFKASGANQTGVAAFVAGGLKLEAAFPGTWGENLQAVVDKKNITDDVAMRFNMAKADLFNLTVREVVGEVEQNIEQFKNVSIKEDAGHRRIDRVLLNESQLVRIPIKNKKPDLPTSLNIPDPEAPPTPPAPAAPPAPPALAPPPPPAPTGGSNGSALSTEDDYGKEKEKTGLFALLKTDIFNLLCIPPDSRGGDTLPEVYLKALAFCAKQRAMLIVDPLSKWNEPSDITPTELGSLNLAGLDSRNAALYFPRVVQPDPKRNGQEDIFVPCGIVAGIMARTDATRGVWKAPAGLDAAMTGIRRLAVNIKDKENGILNPLGVNCLRNFDLNGKVIWGARTLRGADQLADEYKYIPVRRLALFIEESLYRGTQWVIFEPNDEPLWSQIRLNVGAFMNNLFRQGAFQGQSPKEAYFVKCDKETTTQNDINLGIVNVIVGFAPLKPAEFLVIKITQIIGDIQT